MHLRRLIFNIEQSISIKDKKIGGIAGEDP